ncbi:Eaa prophage protein [Enterobacter hormaechei]|nr:Eaa prophage protein [Enterobacter hormaechei]
MSTLTKEWLHQTIADLEEERDAVPGAVNEDAAMALAAMKLALASLEAKDKIPELRQVIYHFRDWNEGFPVERFKADYVISWMLANYPPAQPTGVSVPGDVSGPLAHAYKELTPTFMRNHIDVFERYGIYPDGSAGIQAMRIALDGMNRRAAMLQGSEPVTTTNKLPEETGSSLQLRNLIRQRHAEWSQATFGDVGPVGPLKHLSKEALEAAEEPDDLSEWADMQFLLWDAQRRAGISDGEITAAMEEKLKVNMARQWPEPKDGEPRLHIKAAPQQEVK